MYDCKQLWYIMYKKHGGIKIGNPGMSLNWCTWVARIAGTQYSIRYREFIWENKYVNTANFSTVG